MQNPRPILKLEVDRLLATGCELCGDRPKCGVGGYSAHHAGLPPVMILCYACAARLLAAGYGYREPRGEHHAAVRPD